MENRTLPNTWPFETVSNISASQEVEGSWETVEDSRELNLRPLSESPLSIAYHYSIPSVSCYHGSQNNLLGRTDQMIRYSA